jgi:hypothetical protein
LGNNHCHTDADIAYANRISIFRQWVILKPPKYKFGMKKVVF